MKLFSNSKLLLFYFIWGCVSLLILFASLEFRFSIDMYQMLGIRSGNTVILPCASYVIFLLLWKEIVILLNGLVKSIVWNIAVLTSHRWNHMQYNNSISFTFVSIWFCYRVLFVQPIPWMALINCPGALTVHNWEGNAFSYEMYPATLYFSTLSMWNG